MAEPTVTPPNQTPAPEQSAQPTATTPEKTGGERTYTQAELEQILKDRIAREKEAGAKAAQAAADKAALDAAAKNGEWQKVAEQTKAQLAEMQAAIEARDLTDKKRSIAERVGLPPALAARLIGKTDEEIEKDAKALMDTLPKPAATKPNLTPTNPGANATQQETDAQKRARLFGTTPNVFGEGGGVRWQQFDK
jgi:hypothetical protein